MQNPNQEEENLLMPRSGLLGHWHSLYLQNKYKTVKISINGVSKTSDHLAKMPNPSHELPASFKAPVRIYKTWMFFWPYKSM